MLKNDGCLVVLGGLSFSATALSYIFWQAELPSDAFEQSHHQSACFLVDRAETGYFPLPRDTYGKL